MRSMAALDLDRVRTWFPALWSGPGAGEARFDGPGGSLVPSRVADAVADAMTAGMCQRGSLTPLQRRTEETVGAARAALGDLLGTDPRGVVVGRSMTALTFEIARTLAQGWGPGDEVVVTRLDHDSNIRPWVLAAERVGATVRWLDFDPVTAEREQWDDGNNTLALAPRVAVAYERNDETNDRLEEAGIEVVRIAGSELGSGRGGPRCMSCPIVRDPLCRAISGFREAWARAAFRTNRSNSPCPFHRFPYLLDNQSSAELRLPGPRAAHARHPRRRLPVERDVIAAA